MSRQSSDDTRRQTALSSAAVIEAALALADSQGLDAVTIRRLARELGVTPMALYWHVRSKEELLDGLAAAVFDEIDLSMDASATWQEQLRALLGSLVRALRAHPSIAALLATRTVSSDGGLRATEVVLDVLRRGGFTPAEATQIARHAVSTVANLVGGEPGMVSRGVPGKQADAHERAGLLLESLPPERYPRLLEAATPLTEGIHPDDYAAFGLDLLLAGIASMAARER
ncbi:MAG: TetR/AcrR family transcriptional regulator C-terminal domain-containing protein [Pseudonocardia sp.]|nr:TetR/AcrR family transcriptional regulator C-terminal domain-containing protein [Pseudonocardia sp.]